MADPQPSVRSLHAPIVHLEGVSKSFDGGRSFAVGDVTLSIATGAYVAIIGGSGSGSGKTTLSEDGRHSYVAVWVIGTATLSTPVGQTSLGNYIFSRLQVEN